MYHEIDEETGCCRHCGKRHEQWSDHPNFKECPAFELIDPLKHREVLEDDIRAYIEWDADPVTAFDREVWDKQNANIVRGEN